MPLYLFSLPYSSLLTLTYVLMDNFLSLFLFLLGNYCLNLSIKLKLMTIILVIQYNVIDPKFIEKRSDFLL